MVLLDRPTTAPALLERPSLLARMAAILTHDELVVGGIGYASFDLFTAAGRPQNFYMLGSMGLAVPIGLGLALAQPERQVIVCEGDGSLLMDLGCLATVATLSPPNLTIVVWDNAAYQTTGGQPTATAAGTDLVRVAQGAGLARSDWACDEPDFERLLRRALSEPTPALVAVRTAQTRSTGHPEFDPVILKDRFMRGIGVK